MTLTSSPPTPGPDRTGVPDPLGALARAAVANAALAEVVAGWGEHLARVLSGGGRLLACGNGGSAAEAQHLTAELVGRFRDDRAPYAAVPLGTDVAAITAILNDYGPDEVFARQVRAHGRPGDVLVALSTSGCSTNVLAAVAAARDLGITVWGMTGPAPNPLAAAADDVVAVDAPTTATVQEIHLALVHHLCACLDVALGVSVPVETRP